MSIISWNSIRYIFLVTVFGAVTAVLGKVILFPSPQKNEAKTVQLPKSIPLQGWQQVSSNALEDQGFENSSYQSAKEYQYIQNAIHLSIRAHYIVNTDGDVKGFIRDYPKSLIPDQEALELRSIEGVGSHFIFSSIERRQLSSCINPFGGSTTSIDEYKWNRNFQDIRYRFIPWLLGENLKDERCLWTHISISVDDTDPLAADILIEKAWIDWYEWWSIKLPEMRI